MGVKINSLFNKGVKPEGGMERHSRRKYYETATNMFLVGCKDVIPNKGFV